MKYIFSKLMLMAEEDLESAKHFSDIETSDIETIEESIKTCKNGTLSAAH